MAGAQSQQAFDSSTKAFLEEMQIRLLDMYPEEIRQCLNELTDEQIWWRPHDGSNSVGNLVLHLSGNLDHYLGKGVVGTGYQRNRPGEFSEQGPLPRQELLDRLQRSIETARKAFEGLTPERLLELAELGKESEPIGRLLLSVTTHYNGHVGQIIYVTKMLKQGAFPEELWRRLNRR